MAINFPGSPSLNSTFTNGNKRWKWNSTAWKDDSAAATLSLEGGELSGDLVLAGDPTSPDHAATKAYVDAIPGTGYISSLTSDAQAQLDAKQAVVAGVTNTEIGYIDGVISPVQAQLDAKAPLTPAVNAKTANYTLVAEDRGEFITCDGTFTLTIPNATFTAGDRVDFVNIGTGVITIAGSGVTVNSVDAAVTIDTQFAGATFFFTSPTEGVLIGKLA